MKKYKISILWGESPEDGQEAVTYKFNTSEELDAFLLGIDEMDGWMGFDDTVDEGHIHRERVCGMFEGEYNHGEDKCWQPEEEAV